MNGYDETSRMDKGKMCSRGLGGFGESIHAIQLRKDLIGYLEFKFDRCKRKTQRELISHKILRVSNKNDEGQVEIIEYNINGDGIKGG